MKEYQEFTDLFRQTKTLTFRLLPQGETERHMEENGIIESAKARYDAFDTLKTVIDRNYKNALTEATKDVTADASAYAALYFDAGADRAALWKEAAALRSAVSGRLKEHPVLKRPTQRHF